MTENGDEQGLSWRNRLDRWLGRGTTPESHEHAGGVGGGLPTAYAVGDIHGRLDLLLRPWWWEEPEACCRGGFSSSSLLLLV